MTKYLFKANNIGSSSCQCESAPIMSSGQADCPWCGCGWLMSCAKCAKTFTYAVVQETEVSLINLGKNEFDRRGLDTTSTRDLFDWALEMQEALDHLEVGQIVVCLDGTYWHWDARNIEFCGYYAEHNLEKLPHAEELEQPGAIQALLGNRSYWLVRRLPA